jgi:hypothetical protein
MHICSAINALKRKNMNNQFLLWLVVSFSNMKAIASLVLMVSGNNDGVDLNHVAEMHRLCGGGLFGDMVA